MSIVALQQPELFAPATRADINRLEALTKKLLDTTRPHRRLVTAETKAIHVRTVDVFFGGMCPCCAEVKIVIDGQRTKASNIDHWSDNPSKASPHETWLICERCNADFSHGKRAREDFMTEWNMFQKRRKQVQGWSQPLLL